MNKGAWTYLLELLRLVLCEQAAKLEPLAPAEWREVYRLAAKHAVIGIAWDGVEQLQARSPEALQSMPGDLMGKWFADAQTIQTANSRMAKQAADVQELLRTGGFDSEILKGAALAAYYPKPAHRQAADIDLWVLPRLTANGKPQSLAEYRKSLLVYLRQQPDVTIGEVVYHHIETMMGGTEVECHITPTWLCNPKNNRRLQRMFTQAGQLTPELQELYTLLHAFRHVYHDGIALRHVMDYYLVSRHNRQSGVPVPTKLYTRLGITGFAQAMDEVAVAILAQGEQPQLPKHAEHILEALPERHVSCAVQWDYPQESLYNLPWRGIHYIWRKINHYV